VTMSMPALEDRALPKAWHRAAQRGVPPLSIVVSRAECGGGEAECGDPTRQDAKSGVISGIPAEVFLGSCPDCVPGLQELSAIEELRVNELSQPMSATVGNVSDSRRMVAL
jgi:hypothetical protein